MGIDWLVQGTVAVLVGVVVWYITSRVDAIRRETEQLQDERRKIYLRILEPHMRILSGTKNPSAMKSALAQVTSFEYRKAFFELNMTGSDQVVRAINTFMQYTYKMEQNGTSDPYELLTVWGGLLLAIRRDLGNKRTKLKEVDMLRALIKDIDQAR